MQVRKAIVLGVGTAILLIAAICSQFSTVGCTNCLLKDGAKYRVIQPVYLMAVYESLNSRMLSEGSARAYLHSERYADTAWVAFQREVPVGTIMTISSTAPKVWHLPFGSCRYIVQLDHDLSSGLEIILQLDRGMDGELDGLNSGLFEKKEPA